MFVLNLNGVKLEKSLRSFESRFGNTSNRACAHGNRRLTVPSTFSKSGSKKDALNL
jgi:hypothetical protein